MSELVLKRYSFIEYLEIFGKKRHHHQPDFNRRSAFKKYKSI